MYDDRDSAMACACHHVTDLKGVLWWVVEESFHALQYVHNVIMETRLYIYDFFWGGFLRIPISEFLGADREQAIPATVHVHSYCDIHSGEGGRGVPPPTVHMLIVQVA